VTPIAVETFGAFARRKISEAAGARLLPFHTVEVTDSARGLEEIGNDFTRALFDGPFFQSPVPAGFPQISLVFVQSGDGNTEADDPAALGAGDTDKHLIYEGLSRASVDAVMAGAKTVGDGRLVFSVWHPELVALRRDLGKARHPTQIVATLAAALPIEDSLLCNSPEVPVMLLTAGQPAINLAERVRGRATVAVISSGEHADMRTFAERLRHDLGIERISAIGGRTVATALVDAGLVSDLYLTTSPRKGGTPNTPWYTGARPPRLDLVVRKQDQTAVVFEHWLVRA
jgi:riboflavin biosynthesis pyrimidine reductase